MYFKKNNLTDVTPEETKEYLTDLGFLKFDLTTKTFYNSENQIFPKVKFWFEEIKSFEDSSHVMMRYLAENNHPHTHAIVTSSSCEISEGVKSLLNDFRFIND